MPLTAIPDEICIEPKLCKTLGMIHHAWAAPHVAEDKDGDRAKLWRSSDIVVCPNREEDEQERHEDSEECLGH